MTKTFAERCQLAQQLLPDAQYRAMLTKLHDEMLEALAKDVPEVGFGNKAEQPAQQEPVAIHQFRKRGCSDWYDGLPDYHDGHGPYEVRTLYTTPQAQPQDSMIGATVSMDVSKGDEPEHRIFGRIYEVQEDAQDGVTYLAIEEGRNFDAPQAQPAREPLTDEQKEILRFLGAAEAAHGITKGNT